MNKVMITAIWVASLITTYWFGWSNKVESGSLGTENSDESTGFREIGTSPLQKEDERGKDIARDSSKVELVHERPSLGDEPLKERSNGNNIIRELDASNPIKRLGAFAELLKNPDAKSIKSAVEAYESLPGGPGRFSELQMLAFAWGQVNPVGALAWAQKQEHWDERLASSSIMDSWARYDADAAIAWAKENFEGEENPFFVGIINGLSERSLIKATDLMTELPYGRVRGRSAHILFEKVWSKGEDVAIHWAEHLPEGSLQNFAYGELGEKVARADIYRAIAWVESMEESSIKSAVSEDVARELAKQNPISAGEWVLSMPDGESRQAGLREVAKIWSRNDPAATANWINQFPEGTNVDSAIESLVKQMTSTDPAGALSWAETVSDPQKREKLIGETEKAIKRQKFPAGESK